MSAIAWALAWELGARQRWALRLGGAYLAGLIVLAQALPAGTALPPEVAGYLLVPILGALPWLLASLTYGFNERFESAASAFPRRLFTLPVPTVVLVTLPMLVATTGAALIWCACAWGVLWPSGAKAPVLFPALLLASLVAWSQALSWS